MRFARVFLVVVGLWPVAANAQPPAAARVRAMLSGYEQTPTAAQWRALGPDTLGVLIALYDDETQPPYVRLRAVGATAAFPTPATRTFLLAVARAPGQGDLMIREAVVALGRAFGRSAIADLRPFLAHRETVVREATARTLARLDDPRARSAIRARLSVETDPVVLEALRAPRRY